MTSSQIFIFIFRWDNWVIMESGCDVIPRGLPSSMDPTAQDKKRFQERIDALEKALAAKKGQPLQPSNSNSTNQAATANANAAGAPKKFKTNSNAATLPPTENSKKGSFVENPSKGIITVAALFAGLNLEEMHCFNFHMVGKECTRSNCTHRHTPLTKMSEGNRKKILEHIHKTKCVFINPNLKGNKGLLALLSDDQKENLFPPTTGASN